MLLERIFSSWEGGKEIKKTNKMAYWNIFCPYFLLHPLSWNHFFNFFFVKKTTNKQQTNKKRSSFFITARFLFLGILISDNFSLILSRPYLFSFFSIIYVIIFSLISYRFHFVEKIDFIWSLFPSPLFFAYLVMYFHLFHTNYHFFRKDNYYFREKFMRQECRGNTIL